MTNDTETRNGSSACGCGGGSCCRGPAKWAWIVLAAAVLGVLIAKNAARKPAAAKVPEGRETPAAANSPGAAAGAPETAAQGQALPRLVDLGAGKCIPCKMMAPILEELKKEYAGVFKTEFLDVWQDPEPARMYGIRVIPTQIFFDAEGKELFRHEGYFGKEDILAKWKELGVDLTRP